MIRRRLGTIRGQLILLYLTVLAVLLLGLGIVQSFTLTQYLRSSVAADLRQSGYSQLRVLSPCFINSPGDLDRNAQTLANLMGSHLTAVKIVTASGQTLADHSFGFPGASQPLRLSASTIRDLIGSARPPIVSSTISTRVAPCSQVRRTDITDASGSTRPAASATISEGNLVLVAVPLGPATRPVGFALLARSFADANATIRQTELVFAIGALVALVAAAVVALPLINRALRPLHRVADTAESIAAGSLEQRANLARSSDEVGRLGGAFDSMVDRLQAALMAANESEERMRRFLADASHELRTPLTVLRGTSEVLLRQGSHERPELLISLQGMHEESLRLSKLVDDLLTLTRLDAGQALNPEDVALRPFLEQFVERYGSAWPNRSIALDVKSLDGDAAYVDPDALRRMVMNLVDNAAQYSTAGEPISIGGGRQDQCVLVSVADRGPGLSRDDAERVFERFYRGAKSRSRPGGTGLGLAIVQALARQSGGEVEIDTAPESGTTVSVTLPAFREGCR